MSSVRGGPGEDPSGQGARDHPRSPTADSHGTVDRRRRNGGLAAAVLRLESDGGRIGSIPLSFAALLNSSSPGRSNASDNRVSDIRAEEVPGETMESPFDGGGGTLRLDDFEDPALDVQTVVVAFGRFMLMIASQTLIFNLLLLRLLAMRLFHPNRRVRSPRTREVVCRLCFTTTLYHTGTLSSSWQAAEASSQSGRPRVNVAVVENAETEPVPRTNAAYDAGHENVVSSSGAGENGEADLVAWPAAVQRLASSVVSDTPVSNTPVAVEDEELREHSNFGTRTQSCKLLNVTECFGILFAVLFLSFLIGV